MEVTMKTALLAAKLRTRLVTLKKEHIVAIAKYDVALAQWKSDVIAWLKREVPSRVSNIKKADMAHRYGRSGLPDSVFQGLPSSPPFPSRDHIDKVQKTLRFIALTGQETIRVSQHEVDAWLGKDDSDA